MPVSANSALRTARMVSAAATTNATSVKASRGTVRTVQGRNAAAAPRYLKLYDKASAPTVGTDTPKKTIHLPAGADFIFDYDIYFGNGIAYAFTTAAADADTGALTAGDVVCFSVDYY